LDPYTNRKGNPRAPTKTLEIGAKDPFGHQASTLWLVLYDMFSTTLKNDT